ncbi:MAG: glycosyltransferase [Flavobacteriia bacterium]|nr:glycosyltransferase [Flavobacteriia bacterium]OJX39057.1 MAG: hypothetical protein BGO87_03465 [Flavobacteriia bacterium 40-80]
MQKKKHILFLASWYPNKNAPTLGNFVQKHAEAAALFNEITVIAVFSHTSGAYEIVDVTENNVRSITCYYPKVTISVPLLKQFLQLYRTRKAFDKAFSLYLKSGQKPELVHLNVVYPTGYFVTQLKRKLNIPFVVTEHSTAFHEGKNKMPALPLKMAIRTMNEAAKILPVSEDLKKSLMKHGVTVPMRVISNVVNENIFHNTTVNQPVKSQFIHISTAIDEHKNVSGIIRSIKKLSQRTADFHFLIVSDGILEPFIDLAYNQLNIPASLLSFEGTKTTTEIAEAISESTALVLFSNYENFPCVIPEAFMLGKPVISTAVNGIPEHVNSHNGILIDVRNEEQLTEAMLSVIQQQNIFDAVQIRKYALKHFSYEAVGRQFDEVYNEILAHHVS